MSKSQTYEAVRRFLEETDKVIDEKQSALEGDQKVNCNKMKSSA